MDDAVKRAQEMDNLEKRLQGVDIQFERCKDIIEEKTKLYGVQTIGELGFKGEFLQIHRKYVRLKQMLWDGQHDFVSEIKHRDTLEDTLIDMANYCVLLLTQLPEDEKNPDAEEEDIIEKEEKEFFVSEEDAIKQEIKKSAMLRIMNFIDLLHKKKKISDERINYIKINLSRWFEQSIINGHELQRLYEKDWKSNKTEDMLDFYANNLFFMIANIIYNTNEGAWQYDVIDKFLTDRNASDFKAEIKVLDYGAGTGAIGELFYEKVNFLEYYHKDVDGLGRDFFRFINAKEYHRMINTQYLYPGKLKFNGFFDVAVCLDVLEHLENPFETAKQIIKSVKKDGLIIINYCFHPEHNITHLEQNNASQKKKMDDVLNENTELLLLKDNLRIYRKR